MNIIETKHKWNGTLAKRNSTKYIILHHRAGNGTVESIHAQHLTNGWTGIGYHFYVRKDGSVYSGRPVETVGAHCQGQNSYSVGICFEGNFENEKMSAEQLKAGQELITYLKTKFPDAEVKRHRDFGGTACPGKNFPFNDIKIHPIKKILTSANDITWELNHSYFPIENVSQFVRFLENAKNNNSPLYWGYYKLVNNIR